MTGDERWGTRLCIPIGRNRLAVRTAGDGPPVVLVHGLGASSRYWSANAPALVAAGFRVLAPDLPGFGGSRGAVAAVTPRDQAGALSGWAASMGIPAAVWIGHSLGCQTLLELATVRPDLVRGLVLAAPTGAAGAFRGVRQVLRLARDAPMEPGALRRSLVRSYREAGFVTVFRTWQAGARHRAGDLLDGVMAPALIVSGTADPVVEPGFIRRLGGQLANSRTEWIEGAPHGLHRSDASAFNRLVVRFLTTIEPTEPASPGPAGPAVRRSPRRAAAP